MKISFRKTFFAFVVIMAVGVAYTANAANKSTKKPTKALHSKPSAAAHKKHKGNTATHKIAKHTAQKPKSKKMSEKERKALAWKQVQHARAVAARRKAEDEKKQKNVSLFEEEESKEAPMQLETVKRVSFGDQRSTASTSASLAEKPSVEDDFSSETPAAQDDFSTFDNN